MIIDVPKLMIVCEVSSGHRSPSRRSAPRSAGRNLGSSLGSARMPSFARKREVVAALGPGLSTGSAPRST
jgi:hypothetical protein